MSASAASSALPASPSRSRPAKPEHVGAIQCYDGGVRSVDPCQPPGGPRVRLSLGRGAAARFVFVLGVLLCGLCAAPAWASSGRGAGRDDRAAVAQAKQRFLRGAEHFRLGRFAQAREDFAASYLLSGRVALLYNLALAEERLGNIPAAIENLERYVAAPDIEDRAAVQLHLDELRRRQPLIVAATPEGTQLQRLRLAKWLSLGTGLAAVAAGGALLGVDGRQDCGTAPVQCPTVLDTRIAGATVLTGGLLLVGSAAVLWALERRQGKTPKASLALRLASGRF